MPDLLDRNESAEDERSARLIERSSRSGTGRVPPASELEALLGGDERPARQELRRQIARLERELGELFGTAFPRMGMNWSVDPAGGPRILGMGELELVRDSLSERIARTKHILHERSLDEAEKRDLLELMIAEPQRYPWVRISNEDIGEQGCRHWHSRPRLGIIGMLLGWWRVKLSSGCPLAGGRG